MLIKVTEVGDIETKKEGTRRWKQIRVDYETAEKDDNYKLLLDWANPDAYADAQDCVVGDFYEVTVKKAGKFWNWTAIESSDATEFDDKPSTKGFQKSTASTGTDWAAKNKLDADRFEFEKSKQALIIRQSCIGYAVAALGQGFPTEKYIALASQFEDAVIDGFTSPEPAKVQPKAAAKRNKPDVDEQANFDDDIPF
jgi:hypothetical protein